MRVCITLLPVSLEAQQDVTTFEKRMQAYTANYMEKNRYRYPKEMSFFEESENILLHSTLELTIFEIYDFSGKLIQQGAFKGEEHKIKLPVSQGMYFIRYSDKIGRSGITKMIKL